MKEDENILRILQETKRAIKDNNPAQLRKLSNQTNNVASKTQDLDNITIAVIVYSLSKIIERQEYRNDPSWKKFYNNSLIYLERAIKKIIEKDNHEFRRSIKSIRKEINNLSGNLKNSIEDVFRKASINKASKIYEHGVSLERTAKLLGISTWELQGYSGQKSFQEESLGKISTKKRIKITEDFFKK
jgi:hypothetical protein